MELRIFTEPQQGASYETLLTVARTAEECGFGGFFRSDHYLRMGGVSGLPGPTDAWVTLAALARETVSIRLGTLVNSATFRLPGPLAVSVAQVDEMSGGRIELGLGAGWYEDEHRAYGIPFPGLGERFDRLEEQLAIVSGLWAATEDAPFSFAGSHYQVEASPGLPKPAQRPGPPIIIGGAGPKRTPMLAARYASEFNFGFRPLPDFVERNQRVDAACREIGRDPASVIRSTVLVVCCGTSEAELRRRASRIEREVDELRTNGLCGTPAEIVDRLGTWAEAGATRCYLQVLDLSDLDQVRLIASQVLRAVRDV